MGKVVVLLGSVIAVYWNDLTVIFNEAFNSDLTSYVLIIPFLVAYVAYRERNVLKASAAFDLSNRKLAVDVLEGAIVMGTALTFYWTSSFSSYSLSYRLLTIPFFTCGATLTLFGKRTLRIAMFPAALLLFMAPIPADAVAYWGAILSLYTTSASVAVIQFLGVNAVTTVEYGNPIVQYPSLAGGQVAFAVSIACSGLYSLTGFAAFAAFASYIPRGRIIAKVTLFGLGFGLVYALNIFRVTVILMMGRYYGQGAALETFHTFASSILIFLGTLGLLFLGEKVWRLKFARARSRGSECNHDESHLDLLGGFCSACGLFLRLPAKVAHKREAGTVIIVTALTIIMLMAQVPVFAYARGPNPDTFSIPTGNTSPPNLLPTVNLTRGSWTPEFFYRDQAFEQLNSPYIHAAWIFAYYAEYGHTRAFNPIITSIEVAPFKTFLDPPYVSEVYVKTPYNCDGSGNASFVIPPTDSAILDNNPLPIGNLYSIQCPSDPGVQKIRYWWYETATFRKGSSYVSDSMLNVLHTTGDQLVASGLIEDQNNSTQIAAALRSFATQIVQYWEPVKSASTFAQYLASTRRTISPLISVAIMSGLLYAGYMELNALRKRSEVGRITSKFRTPEDQTLIEIASKQSSGITLRDAMKGMSAAGYLSSEVELIGKITAAESLGVLRRSLVLEQDNATQRWRLPQALLSRFSFVRSRQSHS